MEPQGRRPGESDLEFHQRLTASQRAEQQRRLQNARLQAMANGKETFDYERFRPRYQNVSATVPGKEAMEAEYYLQYHRCRNLDEFILAVQQTDLYDGGDMHLDP